MADYRAVHKAIDACVRRITGGRLYCVDASFAVVNAITAAGWRVVPQEPTEEMLRAIGGGPGARDRYMLAIASAPDARRPRITG